MKEAIGSSYIFVICLTFIILFTGYIAISVNYNKAFQIKNYIISKIEEEPGGYNSDLGDEITTYLTAQGYTAYGKCEDYLEGTSIEGDPTIPTAWKKVDCLGGNGSNNECGVCIYKKDIKDNTVMDDFNKDKSYYRVTTFFKFDLPVVNVLLNFQINGTSKYVMDK